MKKLKLNSLVKKNLSTSEMKAITGGNTCYCLCPTGGQEANMNSTWATGGGDPNHWDGWKMGRYGKE